LDSDSDLDLDLAIGGLVTSHSVTLSYRKSRYTAKGAGSIGVEDGISALSLC